MKIIEDTIYNYKNRSFAALENHYRLSQTQSFMPDTIIAGGAARQIFLGEVFGSTDIDIYSPTYRDQTFILDKLFQLVLDQNRLTTQNAFNFTLYSNKVQLIKKIYTDDIEELFDSYDFACCMFAIKGNRLYYTEQAIEDALHKWITVVNYDKESLRPRIGKYLKKGYVPHCERSMIEFEKFIKHGKEYDNSHLLFTNGAPPTMDEIFTSFFGISPEGY